VNYPFLTQKERDNETGLDYFLARYYSSTQGRFVSVDPLRASARPQDPQSWNRYTYALNRATIAIDPDGLSTIVVTVNPRSRGGNGHATVQVFDKNGNDVAVWNGSNRIDGRAIGKGPDRTKKYYDTPFGVYAIKPNHNGSNANGTDGGVAGVAARPKQPEFGTGIITMQPVSGEVSANNRDSIYIHGGGRDPAGGLSLTLDAQQPLTPTQGCVRTANEDIDALIGTVNNLAQNGDPISNVFIGDVATLNAQADERDKAGNYRYPELRNAGFGSPDRQGKPTGNAQP